MFSQASNEADRLTALRTLAIMDSPEEAHFDAVCRLARDVFAVPISLISFIETDRQWFKARCGMDHDGTPRANAFCDHTIGSDDAFVVEDAALDPRFAANPLVVGQPDIRFYAGVPLALRPGIRVGSLCIIDTVPRTFSTRQVCQLRDMAEIVLAHLRLHEAARAHMAELENSRRLSSDLRETRDLLRTTLENMDQGLILYGPDMTVRLHNTRAREILDLPDDVLREGNAYSTINAYQVERGEYRSSPGHLVDALEAGTLRSLPERYERERPDGSSLDVRVLPLADGSHMRTYTDTTRYREVERSVRESEARYRVLAEFASDMIVRRTINGRGNYISPASRDLLGYTPEEVSASSLSAAIHPDDRKRAGEVRSALQTGRLEQARMTYRLRHKDGRWIWVEARARLVRDEAGRPVETITAVRDISERMAAEEALRESEERLALALDSGSDALWDWCVVSDAVNCSRHWFRMLGYGDGELSVDSHSWRMLIHPDDVIEAGRRLVDHLKAKTPLYECEYRLRRRDGSYIWTLVRGKVVARDPDGRAQRMVGTQIDIERRKVAEQQIAHMATHDVLTGLPNRALFRDRLDHEIASMRRHGGDFAVLACDLDRFKAVNDKLGHPAGDALLRTIADRLRSVVRESDTVARLGGDEFALILARPDGPQNASFVAQRVIEAVSQPVDLDGHTVQVGISIGIVIGSQDTSGSFAANSPGAKADAVFKKADIALYRTKALRRNTFAFYESDMDAERAGRNSLERDLRAALHRGDFALHYQPVMHLADDATTGFEALLRWHHPTRGLISPGEFIPVAEETGLIAAIGAFVLAEACREAAGWPESLRVAVNVSAMQVRQPGLEQAVMNALAASGLAAHRLELDVTESVLMQDSEAATACLHRLRDLGVRISLDDFGTGCSSLNDLRRFPFDRIKIDRTFVADISDPNTAAIVRAIVGIGQQLGTAITAEGVETLGQLAEVRRAGCTEMQGFLYSQPLAAADALAFLRAEPNAIRIAA